MRNHKAYRNVQTGPRVTTEYQARFHPTRNAVATSTFKKKDPHHPQAEPTANVTTVRNHKAYRNVQTGPRVTTEYQARFHPTRNAVATSTFKKKDPHHPQAEPTANVTTVRSVYVSTQWVKTTAKADTRGTQRPLNENFTTIYQDDFKAWKPERRKPFRAHHSLSVDQGLSGVEDNNKNTAIVDARSTKQTKEKAPFEGVTTYSSDFVHHPVQPRTKTIRKVHQTSEELLKESYIPNLTSATKQLSDANDFFQQFQVWSLETKLHGHPKDYMLQSTFHGGHVEPKNQRTKPALPTQTDTSKGLPQTFPTREFYRAWKGPESSSAQETSDWSMKTTFSKHDPKPAETKVFSTPRSKVRGSTHFKTATQRHQRPAEGRGVPAFECSTGMFWSGSLNGGMSWF